MANLFFVVEGETEEDFIGKVLAPYYQSRHFIKAAKVPNKRNSHKRNDKGGLISYRSCVDVCNRFLRTASNADKIILLLDYYGLNHTFIDSEVSSIVNVYDKINHIQRKLENDIDDKRFKFHLQLHEYEALLFSDVDILGAYFEGQNQDQLYSIIQQFDNQPEKINNHIKTAPSKRIKQLFGKSFSKNIAGVTIAQQIGIPRIREKCPHFNSLCNLIDQLPRSERF
jgi:hypothetical protein